MVYITRTKINMKKILSLIAKHKRFLLPLMGVVILFLAFPSLTFADTDSADAASSGGTFDDIAQDLMRLITIALSFLQILLYPLVTIVGALMDNELIIGAGMEGKLREIWVIIRDWVNIFFVLALVVIALYNVLGVAGEGSNYALKSILPKIVIGLVAVNFSFLAGKVLLDATAVLTSAVYALPTDLDLWDDQAGAMEARLCDLDAGNDGSYLDGEDQLAIADGSLLAFMFCEQEEGEDPEYFNGITDGTPYAAFNSFGQSYFQNFGAHNVALTLMVNMGQVTTIDLVSSSDDSIIDQFSNLTLQTLFGILMFLMFGFAYVAMVVVLLARVVILWICLALSPFIVLLFLFPDLTNFGGNELDLKTQFFKHLFVPVVMGVVFSVGFTMLSVFQGSTSGSWLGAIGVMDVDIETISNAFGPDISQFQDLIIAVAAVIIIWTGTFAAASQTIASNWTQTIKGAGEATGKFLASTPLYATVIPIQTATGKSEVGLMNVLGAIPGMVHEAKRDRERKTQEMTEHFLGKGSPVKKLENDVIDKARGSTSPAETQERMRGIVDTKGTRGDGAGWAKMLGDAGVYSALELDKLPQAKKDLLQAAITKGDSAVYELLAKDGDIQEKVFGERGMDGWHDNDPEESSKKPAPSEDEAAKKEKKQKKVDAVAGALGTTPAGGTPPATVAKLTEDQRDEVDAVLKEGDLSVAQMQQLFTNPNDPALKDAIAAYDALGDGRHMMSTEMGGIAIQGGKIDSGSFVAAIAAYKKKGAPTSPDGQAQAGADTSTAGAGGAPTGAPPAGSPPLPGSPPLAPGGPPLPPEEED